eukprot:6304674-Lingulodinium_polyedra.AAC.1
MARAGGISNHRSVDRRCGPGAGGRGRPRRGRPNRPILQPLDAGRCARGGGLVHGIRAWPAQD